MVKLEFKKRQVIKTVIHNSMTSFKTQIRRIESALKHIFANSHQEHKSPSKFYSKNSLMYLETNTKYLNKNDRGDLKFFDESYRKHHRAELEKSFNINLKNPGGKMSLSLDAVKTFKSCYKGIKDNFLSKKDNLILRTLGFAGEKSGDYMRLIEFLGYEFETMSIYIRKGDYKCSFWTNE